MAINRRASTGKPRATVVTLAIESTADPIAVDVVDIGDRRLWDFVVSQGLISMISIEFEVLHFIIC